jgi:CheY-like chemotaxis protein
VDVLLIDDQELDRTILAAHLEALGTCKVHAYSDPVEGALEACRRDFDLVVLDNFMSKADGIWVTRYLRSHPQYRDVPIVIVTSTDTRDKALEAGATEFFSKPVRAADFQARIRELLA